ncbi:MAG: hypothetical protein HeimC3_30940 [Candidatus Heimdallarchaeota archaeon LC_3]|nr:MAG: hypothetical protein HeimC3_30940 [Candidatus Heimdallarchaeota archaeon LC_3]
MSFIDDIIKGFESFIGTEFGLLFILTMVVWGGFILYLTYIYKKIKDLKSELNSIKKLDQ